ncbi:MAG: transaldolase family protein, partial [Acidimicrobiia bacterium]
PAYSDLLYVEGLVAASTVNTMPLQTIDAYQDHGDSDPRSFNEFDIEKARGDLATLAEVGVDYDDVTQTLEDEGVEKFVASWHELLADVGNA